MQCSYPGKPKLMKSCRIRDIWALLSVGQSSMNARKMLISSLIPLDVVLRVFTNSLQLMEADKFGGFHLASLDEGTCQSIAQGQ